MPLGPGGLAAAAAAPSTSDHVNQQPDAELATTAARHEEKAKEAAAESAAAAAAGHQNNGRAAASRSISRAHSHASSSHKAYADKLGHRRVQCDGEVRVTLTQPHKKIKSLLQRF